MKVVVFDYKGDFECHKADCRDVAKKQGFHMGSSWEENSLEEAEVNFNEDLGVENGYDPPWVWEHHVQVFPCAKERS